MKLRPYQTKAVNDIPKLLKKHKRVLAVAPTGSGKTVIGAALIRKLLTHRHRVLWLVHRVELVAQAYDQLLAAGVPKRDLGRRDGQVRLNESMARVLVASIQSYDPTGQAWGLIVVDEAHHVLAQSYTKALAGAKQVLGLTASPWRLDGAPLGDAFDRLYEVATSTELVAAGHVVAPVCFGVPHERIQSVLKGVRANGDYNEGELAEAMSRRYLIGDIVKHWERHAQGRSTIVYTVNREHGRKVFDRFCEGGHSVAYLDGDTPAAARAEILDGLRDGDIQIVVSINVLSEGFDCAPVKCIVLARPTKSLSTYLQQVGRGSRPHGKLPPLVLDHAGNVNRHGFPQIDREWSLTMRAKPLKGGGASQHCPECDCECPSGSRECAECGYEFPWSEQELAEHEGELERLAEEQAFRTRLEALAAQKISDPKQRQAWVERVIAGGP